MKKILCILAAVAACVAISAVLILKQKEKNISFTVNNFDSVDSLCTKKYSISDLREFADKYSPSKTFFSAEKNNAECTYSMMNKRFPTQCIRAAENLYSVYKVKEGGLYYVFWNVRKDGMPVIAETLYIDSLRSQSDFASIKVGESTYADVSKISSENELRQVSTESLCSITLLENGLFANIYYELKSDNVQISDETTERIKSKEEWIVSSIEFENRIGVIRDYCFIPNVFDSDLPRSE